MNKILSNLSFLVFTVVFSCAHSVSASVSSGNPESIELNTIITNIPELLAVVLFLLETALRLFPTKKNRSLLNLLVKVLNVLIPNQAKLPNGGTGIFQPVNFKRAK